MSSGAHISGKNRVTMEWGDDFDTYSKGPLELADLMNAAVSAGVTMPSFAGFGGVDNSVYPPPCALCFIGLGGTMTTNTPQWKDFGALTGYFARTTQVVEKGRPSVDVTVYHDGGLSSVYDDNVPLWSGQQLGESGYTYDLIDPVDLATNAASARSGRLFGDGPDYRALIIDNRSSLDVGAVRAIVRDVDRGLRVVIVGTVPSTSDGLADPTADHAVVRHAMSAVLASPRGVHVATEDDVPAALEQLGVGPSVRFTGGGGDLQKVHRRDGADDYWWIYNPTNAPITTTGDFATTGAPYALDLWNGTITPVAQYVQDGDRTRMPLTVPAHGTVAYAFQRGNRRLHVTATSADGATYATHGSIQIDSALGGTPTVTLSDHRTRRINLGPVPAPVDVSSWHLHTGAIAPSGATTHDLDLSQLEDWRDIPEIASAVGSAVYTTTVNVPSAWLGADHDVRLDLGGFAGASHPYVNGTLVTAQTTPGGAHDIGALLHAGPNQIELTLDTTLNNENAQLAASGNLAYGTGPTPLTPAPSGLLGPVTLTPIAVAHIG